MPAKLWTICNRKGGVGKTTATFNIASIVASAPNNKKVLVIDGDSQRNCTGRFIDENTAIDKNLYHVFKNKLPFAESIYRTEYPNIYLIPADYRLDTITESDFQDEVIPKLILKNLIDTSGVRDVFDYIIMDSPPSTGFITLSSIFAADYTLIPTDVCEDSLKGIRYVKKIVAMMKKSNLNAPADGGIILTRHEKANATEIMRLVSSMKEEFPSLYDFYIPSSVVVKDSNNHKKPLIESHPNHKATKAFHKLTHNIIEKGCV